MPDSPIKTQCEECGGTVEFSRSLLDSVQECPECGAYVDVVEAAQKPYDWKKEHQRLWDTFVPASGQADTVQGELVRIVGKLTDEAYRNGNMNWDADCERMWRFVGNRLNDPAVFSAEERAEIADLIDEIIENKDTPDLSFDGSTFYLVNEKVIDWCMAHPGPIPHAKDPNLLR
jgi:hypothetical protein